MEQRLFIRHEPTRLQILRDAMKNPILVQRARADERPFIHPLIAPDGKGCLTENEPGHHLWQHGIYSGLHGVNGEDFWCEGLSGAGLLHDGTFHSKPIAAPIVVDNSASWQIDTSWRSRAGSEILVERQSWKFIDHGSFYHLDLDWDLTATVNVQFDQCAYGGLFIRMPWRSGVDAVALDSEGRGHAEAEGKRSRWVGVSMPIEGRVDHAGIACLDHPSNSVHPSPWRVDGNFGFSPSRCILGGWNLAPGKTASERYRLFIFLGEIDGKAVERTWSDFSRIQFPETNLGGLRNDCEENPHRRCRIRFRQPLRKTIPDSSGR